MQSMGSKLMLPWKYRCAPSQSGHGVESQLSLVGNSQQKFNSGVNCNGNSDDQESEIRLDLDGVTAPTPTTLSASIMVGLAGVIILKTISAVRVAGERQQQRRQEDQQSAETVVDGSAARGEAATASGAAPNKNKEWIKEMRGALMVVTSLIATVTYQAGVTPPQGTWKKEIKTGGSVQYSWVTDGIEENNTFIYNYGIYRDVNSTALAASLGTIVVLLVTRNPYTMLHVLGVQLFVFFTLVMLAWAYDMSITCSSLPVNPVPLLYLMSLVFICLTVVFATIVVLTFFKRRLARNSAVRYITQHLKIKRCCTALWVVVMASVPLVVFIMFVLAVNEYNVHLYGKNYLHLGVTLVFGALIFAIPAYRRQ